MFGEVQPDLQLLSPADGPELRDGIRQRSRSTRAEGVHPVRVQNDCNRRENDLKKALADILACIFAETKGFCRDEYRCQAQEVLPKGSETGELAGKA